MALCLFSCGGNTSSSIYIDPSFGTDLNEILNNDGVEYTSEEPFLASVNISPSTSNEDYFNVSLLIEYKDTELKNIKIITVPASLSTKDEIANAANVGYFEKPFTLSSSTIVEEYKFKGFRLTYLISDAKDNLKFSIKSDVVNKIYYINSEDFISI